MPRDLRSLRYPAAIVIGVVWCGAFLVGIVTRDYVALGATTPAVVIVTAAIFAIRNGNGGKG